MQDHAGQGEEGDGVGKDHQLVEQIGELPDEVVGSQGAQEDEEQGDDLVDNHGSVSEQVDRVDAAEHIPAQNCGKGKEEQTDRDKDVAESCPECGSESGLRQVCPCDGLSGSIYFIPRKSIFQNAAGGVQSGDNDEGIEAENDKGVYENTDYGDNALVVRSLDVGLRVGVGGGAHACLIGEEAALCALGDGSLECHAEAAAYDGLGLEGILEDHAKSGGYILDAHYENDQAAGQKDRCHDRHDFFRDIGEAFHTADKDDGTGQDQDDTDDPGRNTESCVHCGADRVGLHHASKKSQGQNDRHCKEVSQEFAEGSVEGSSDVVDRSALNMVFPCVDPGLLGQNSFGVDGRHAEEGDDPHPENGSGAAGQNRAGRADDVAGTDLGCNGCRKCLEGTHAFFMFFAVEGKISEDIPQSFAEAPDLNKTCPDRVPQSDQQQQDDQYIVRQIGIDCLNDI